MRVENEHWNAYLALSAPPGTPENWLLLGSISLAALVADPELQDRFRHVMRAACGALLVECFDATSVSWSGPVPVLAEPSGRA